jgi:hypothetical protein
VEKVYVTHTCKNSRLNPDDTDFCDRAFMEIDYHNVKDTPPTYLYCPECVKKGFKNPSRSKKKEIKMSHIINFTREEIPSNLMTLKEIEIKHEIKY